MTMTNSKSYVLYKVDLPNQNQKANFLRTPPLILCKLWYCIKLILCQKIYM